MATQPATGAVTGDTSPARQNSVLSLYQLLDPAVLADPYPLYHQLRNEDPVHWDPFLHAWVVTRYEEVVRVLQEFSADRTFTPQQLEEMGLSQLSPIAEVMVKQMLFMDPPAHTRLRGLCSQAFTPRRVEMLRSRIQGIADRFIQAMLPAGRMDVIRDFAAPLPATVTAELLGVPTSDHVQLKAWSADFAEMLGNFQHNPDRTRRVLRSVQEMTAYFQAAIAAERQTPGEGLVHHLLLAEVDGNRLSDEEIIANLIVTMVGGQETTTNLIGNGLLTLLRNPEVLNQLRLDPSLIPSAVEELLRYESPSQHTARIAPIDVELGGKNIKRRDAIIAVMGAANRDPLRFPDPDRLDVTRKDNRHVAFGAGAHFCFGAPLARMEAQIAFSALLQRLPGLKLESESVTWRNNLGLRGLTELWVSWSSEPNPATRTSA
jgi:cytochrome P450